MVVERILASVASVASVRESWGRSRELRRTRGRGLSGVRRTRDGRTAVGGGDGGVRVTKQSDTQSQLGVHRERRREKSEPEDAKQTRAFRNGRRSTRHAHSTSSKGFVRTRKSLSC